jgi:hypothetical protein
MEPEIYMHGHLQIYINSEKPYSESDIIDPDALLQSMEADGEYFIFSCCCGMPSCNGWEKGMQVTHEGTFIAWVDPNTNRSWRLDKEKMQKDLKNVREELSLYKTYFMKKEIEYVGVGYNW